MQIVALRVAQNDFGFTVWSWNVCLENDGSVGEAILGKAGSFGRFRLAYTI